MQRIYNGIFAAVLFGVGCAIPMVLGQASSTQPKCICPGEAADIDFDLVPGTPRNPEPEAATAHEANAPVAADANRHFDFILYDAPIHEARFVR